MQGRDSEESKESKEPKESKVTIQQTLDLIDDENFSKCFAAIEKDDAERLRALIEHGADIKQAKRNGKSAIMVAAIKDSWGCVEVILDCFSPIFKEFDHSESRQSASKLAGVLLLAVKANQVGLLKKWFEQYAHQYYSGGFFIKDLGFFLTGKVWQDSDNGYTALHWAVQHSNFDFIGTALALGSTFGTTKLVKTKNNDEETFLDLAFKLKKMECAKWLSEASTRRGEWRLKEAIKASNITTLYDFLMLNVYAYSDSRQDKLLEYMLALPDRDKPVALTTALNQTTKLGSYMAAGASFERHRRIMQAELQRLVAPQAEPPQPTPPEPSVDSKKVEELKPIYKRIPGVSLIFSSGSKKTDEEKKDSRKKSEEKEVEKKDPPRKKLTKCDAGPGEDW